MRRKMGVCKHKEREQIMRQKREVCKQEKKKANMFFLQKAMFLYLLNPGLQQIFIL